MREKLSYGFGGFVDQIMSGTFLLYCTTVCSPKAIGCSST